MTNQIITPPYSPDWVSPPGDTILDLLEERDWTQDQLADRLGYSTKHVSQLIKGKVSLSEDAAVRLQSVLGAPVGFWLKREALYRERAALLDAQTRHASMVSWLEGLPVRELMDAGGIMSRPRIDEKSKPAIVAEMLGFFGVATPAQWQSTYGEMHVSFRRSRPEQTDIGAISTWLRMGERQAEKMEGLRYNEAAFRASLKEIRSLTTLPCKEFAPKLRDLFRQSGVALVFVPSIPRARVSGVARWLNAHRPLVQLSLYGKSNDKFWFTLFHEAAHIILHAAEKKTVYLDDPSKAGTDSKEEREANFWASDVLIPNDRARELSALPKTKAAICAFAESIDVHVGIVVGRLQHDKLMDVTWLNYLKENFEASDFNA